MKPGNTADGSSLKAAVDNTAIKSEKQPDRLVSAGPDIEKLSQTLESFDQFDKRIWRTRPPYYFDVIEYYRLTCDLDSNRLDGYMRGKQYEPLLSQDERTHFLGIHHTYQKVSKLFLASCLLGGRIVYNLARRNSQILTQQRVRGVVEGIASSTVFFGLGLLFQAQLAEQYFESHFRLWKTLSNKDFTERVKQLRKEQKELVLRLGDVPQNGETKGK